MSEYQGLHASPAEWPRALFYVALAFSCYQIITAAFHPVSTQVLRAGHVGFLLMLVYLVYPVRGSDRPWQPLAWVLALAGMATFFYQWYFEADLIQRSGDLTTADMVIGLMLIALVFEAARRVMGIALPIICGLFLAYGLFGNHLPGDLAHRGYGLDQIVNQLSFGTEGLYGTPTYVSATYIFLFILFGSFLEQAGMIRLFTDFAMGLFGHRAGGPAKVSVVSSALMGTITGSGVANVVTTGQFTIPLMKRFGYRAAFAGGVEATSSMGAQLMPPVMGAVAFIMAETLGVEYIEVVRAAIIPAILYFMSAFWMVHLEAGRRSLFGLPRSELPSPLAAIKAQWYLLLPLIALIFLLFSGYTPLYAGTIGLALTVLLILGGSLALRLPGKVIRLIFWIGLGLVSAALMRFGTYVIVAAVLGLIAANLFSKGGRETLAICRDSLAEGARTALPVGIACAIVGIIVGTMTLTGMANTFGQFIVHVGESNLFLSLVLTMVTCLLLGMGIPTVPNYIITATIAGPALLQLGVPLIVSHMFVFYFGILADLTPPVALACFAAAPIAKENGLKISLEAIKIAAAGFVIPYMAVFTPALMLQDGGELSAAIGFWPAVVYVVFKALLAIGLWGVAVVGFLHRRMGWPERLLAMAAAFLLVAALPLTDEVGLALVAVFIAWQVWSTRRDGPASAASNG